MVDIGAETHVTSKNLIVHDFLFHSSTTRFFFHPSEIEEIENGIRAAIARLVLPYGFTGSPETDYGCNLSSRAKFDIPFHHFESGFTSFWHTFLQVLFPLDV